MNYQNYSIISLIKACHLLPYNNFSVQFELLLCASSQPCLLLFNVFLLKVRYLHTNYEVFCKERLKALFVEGGNPLFI